MMAAHDTDDTHERRARLRPTAKVGTAKLQHDFRNRLAVLVFAARERDDRLTAFYSEELEAMYGAVLGSIDG